jgi:hypothetical protein
MSERGSFVTQYIYCPRCFEIVKDVLVDDDKYLDSMPIKNQPIVAGKIGGLYANEEAIAMEIEFGTALNERLCHRVKVAVLCEAGRSKIFKFGPLE